MVVHRLVLVCLSCFFLLLAVSGTWLRGVRAGVGCEGFILGQGSCLPSPPALMAGCFLWPVSPGLLLTGGVLPAEFFYLLYQATIELGPYGIMFSAVQGLKIAPSG